MYLSDVKMCKTLLVDEIKLAKATIFATAILNVSAAAIFPIPEKSKNKMDYIIFLNDILRLQFSAAVFCSCAKHNLLHK